VGTISCKGINERN